MTPTVDGWFFKAAAGRCWRSWKICSQRRKPTQDVCDGRRPLTAGRVPPSTEKRLQKSTE